MCALDETEMLIVKQGGIELIIQAMKLHPNHAGVQENACGALKNLAMRGQ
jgi:hypothetical protein